MVETEPMIKVVVEEVVMGEGHLLAMVVQE